MGAQHAEDAQDHQRQDQPDRPGLPHSAPEARQHREIPMHIAGASTSAPRGCDGERSPRRQVACSKPLCFDRSMLSNSGWLRDIQGCPSIRSLHVV
eukprot:6491487-Alexandrium_andersonii.AAC.1